MRGEKTVTFDFAFTYSDKGHFVEAREITIRAPGISKFDTHARMKAWVGKAVLAFSSIARPTAASDDEPPAQDGDDDQDVMQLMSMGLGVDDYTAFCAFVKKALTGSTLATVGESKIPVSDEIWIDLEDKGGMEAVFKVMSEFTGFFFAALQKSPKPNGAAPAPSSASPSKAPSPTKPRALSRLPS